MPKRKKRHQIPDTEIVTACFCNLVKTSSVKYIVEKAEGKGWLVLLSNGGVSRCFVEMRKNITYGEFLRIIKRPKGWYMRCFDPEYLEAKSY